MLTCPSCGRENPDTSRFCAACGSALATDRGREVRKTVTVVFADVTGSTALGERLDPESFRRVMARYFDAARSCLERHGGTVEKFIGDAVMAVFGVPTVHEDDALRALRAAVEIRDALASLNDDLERDHGVSLLLRTGVNTGEVVTGTEERLATGDAVNIAARLEQAAQPGEILIGEQTRALASGAIEVVAVAPLTLKGKERPVVAYRLLRVVEGAPAFDRRLDAPLIGRDNELGRLRAEFDAAVSERRCGLVTVLGPPGIGKSRLARELEAALADDATVLSGSCLPYGEGITYWPLVEIFRQVRAEHELESALSAGGPEEIFLSVRKAFEKRSRERPLTLVIEDIHWAEPTLLDLLDHLVDWTRDAPLLVLCLARPELLDERPAWGGQARAQTIRLEPLSQAESDELIEELLSDGPALRKEIHTRIRDTAEGNPLFVEQLLAARTEGGVSDDLPPTVHALLAARLDGLPDEERDVLERASVVGWEFEWEALAVLAADGSRPPGARLATLVRKELILAHEEIADLFRFRHMLIRDAAYERIPKELRSELHERFADWLEGRGQELDEIVGYHLEQAYRSVEALGPVGERGRALAGRAVENLAVSARRADARGDTAAAVRLFERALALLPPDDRRRAGLQVSFGRSLRDAGQIERALTVLEEAADVGNATGERVAAARADVALADLRFQRTAETGVGREDVLQQVEAAIPLFEELGDDAGLARALGLAGKLRFWKGEPAGAFEDLDRAARLARGAGDRAEEAESLGYMLSAMQRGPMPVDEAVERLDEMRALGDTNLRFKISWLQGRAQLEAMLGRFDVARGLVAEGMALSEGLGLMMRDDRVAIAAGSVELLAGDAAAAERELRRACETLERIGELGYLASAAPLLVEALIALGQEEEALELSERWRPDRLTVREDVDAQVGWRRVRARLLARRGDLDEAERLGREAVAMVASTEFLPLHAGALEDLAEVLRLAGKPDEAATVLGQAIRLHTEKGDVASVAALAGATPSSQTSPG